MTLFKFANTGNYFVDKNTGQYDEVTGVANTYSLYYPGGSVYSNLTGTVPAIGAGPFTAELWFNVTSFAAGLSQYIVDSSASTLNQGYWMQLFATTVAANAVMRAGIGTTISLTGTTVIQLNTWYHAALVKDTNASAPQGEHNLKLYLNGYLEASNTDTTTITSAANFPKIGNYNTGAIPFNGYISNYRQINGAALYTSLAANASPVSNYMVNRQSFRVPKRALGQVPGTQFIIGASANTAEDKGPGPLSSSSGYSITATGAVVSSSSVVPFLPQFGTKAAQKMYANSGLCVASLSEVDNLAGTQGSIAFITASSVVYTDPYNNNMAFGTGDFTIEFWYNPTSVALSVNYIAPSAGNQTSISWIIGSGGTNAAAIKFTVSNASVYTSYESATLMTTGTWNHIAFVRIGTNLRGYLNGVVVINVTDSTNLFVPASGLQLGAVSGVVGNMANLRIVKGTGLYTANFTPPNGPLAPVDGTVFLINTNYNAANLNATFADSSIGTRSSFLNQYTVTSATASASHPTYNTGNYSKLSNTGNLTITGGYDEVTYAGNSYSVAFNGSSYLTYNPVSLPANTTSNSRLNYGYTQYPSYNQQFFGGGGATSSFTVECWIRLNSLGLTQYIIDLKNTGSTLTTNGPPAFYVNSSNQLVWQASSALSYTSSAILTTGTWYHVVYMRQRPGYGFMFINGVLASGATGTDTTSYYIPIPSIRYIGSDYTGVNYFNGNISNLRISAGTIYANTGFTSPTAALSNKPSTLLLACHSATINEGSYNNYTISTVGTPSVSTTIPFAL